MTVSETTLEMPWGVGPETTLREFSVPLLAAPETAPAPGAPASHERPPETPSQASRVWSAVWPALVGIPLGLLIGGALLITAWQCFLWSVTR